MMRSNRMAIFLAALMLAASVGAILARPGKKLSEERPAISLDAMVPRQFGDWHEAPSGLVQVVNPQTKEVLDKLYSQVLARVYVNSAGYRVMLSIAYGSDQRGSLQAHKPDVCYPAQGFVVEKSESALLATATGDVRVQRMLATLGARQEPVTYWFTFGDTVVQGTTQKKIVELMFGLTGRIPDGLLFRVSSIDPDPVRAFQLQDQFSYQLLQSLPPADRKRLSGLDS